MIGKLGWMLWSLLQAGVYSWGRWRGKSWALARDLDFSSLQAMKSACRRRGILFLWSSAGEYEKGLPLMKRVDQAGFDSVVCFFSQSGPAYLRSRGKVPYAYFLAPQDRVRYWRRIFAVLYPEMTVVVRHEFWPGFLKVAHQRILLWLVDGQDAPV